VSQDPRQHPQDADDLEGVAGGEGGVDVGEGDPDRCESRVRFVVGADDEGIGRNDLAGERDLLVLVGVWVVDSLVVKRNWDGSRIRVVVVRRDPPVVLARKADPGSGTHGVREGPHRTKTHGRSYCRTGYSR